MAFKPFTCDLTDVARLQRDLATLPPREQAHAALVLGVRVVEGRKTAAKPADGLLELGFPVQPITQWIAAARVDDTCLTEAGIPLDLGDEVPMDTLVALAHAPSPAMRAAIGREWLTRATQTVPASAVDLVLDPAWRQTEAGAYLWGHLAARAVLEPAKGTVTVRGANRGDTAWLQRLAGALGVSVDLDAAQPTLRLTDARLVAAMQALGVPVRERVGGRERVVVAPEAPPYRVPDGMGPAARAAHLRGLWEASGSARWLPTGLPEVSWVTAPGLAAFVRDQLAAYGLPKPALRARPGALRSGTVVLEYQGAMLVEEVQHALYDGAVPGLTSPAAAQLLDALTAKVRAGAPDWLRAQAAQAGQPLDRASRPRVPLLEPFRSTVPEALRPRLDEARHLLHALATSRGVELGRSLTSVAATFVALSNTFAGWRRPDASPAKAKDVTARLAAEGFTLHPSAFAEAKRVLGDLGVLLKEPGRSAAAADTVYRVPLEVARLLKTYDPARLYLDPVASDWAPVLDTVRSGRAAPAPTRVAARPAPVPAPVPVVTPTVPTRRRKTAYVPPPPMATAAVRPAPAAPGDAEAPVVEALKAPERLLAVASPAAARVLAAGRVAPTDRQVAHRALMAAVDEQLIPRYFPTAQLLLRDEGPHGRQTVDADLLASLGLTEQFAALRTRPDFLLYEPDGARLIAIEAVRHSNPGEETRWTQLSRLLDPVRATERAASFVLVTAVTRNADLLSRNADLHPDSFAWSVEQEHLTGGRAMTRPDDRPAPIPLDVSRFHNVPPISSLETERPRGRRRTP